MDTWMFWWKTIINSFKHCAINNSFDGVEDYMINSKIRDKDQIGIALRDHLFGWPLDNHKPYKDGLRTNNVSRSSLPNTIIELINIEESNLIR